MWGLLVLGAVLIVAVILGGGLYSLLRGGEFARKYSNTLMWYRVGFQGLAVLIIMLAILFSGRG